MSEIKMRTPSGGRSSIAVQKSGNGVSIKFSRSSDGEVLVMLPRYAAEQLVERVSSALSTPQSISEQNPADDGERG